jgi:hypothetical protein
MFKKLLLLATMFIFSVIPVFAHESEEAHEALEKPILFVRE